MSAEATPKFGLGRIISYGAGDFAVNLSFTFSSLFLLYFYTDVLGLAASTAGLIIMTALIWEGATDPVIGILTNRTRSRWGRYRPYLLWGAVPLGLSVVAMFVPTGLQGGSLVAYCFITHLIYRTIFTVVSIPYGALSARMTQDSHVRGKLAAARMMFAIACGLLLASSTLPLVKALGGGQMGFFLLNIGYSIIATAILFLCFATTREVAEEDEEHSHPGFGEMLRTLRANRPFLLLFAATAVGCTGYTMSGKALVYYLKYWVGSEKFVTLGLVTTLGCAALAMIPWVLITKRTSKRMVWISGATINIIAFATILAFAPKGGPLLWMALGATGVGNSAFILTFWSMLPDTVEYGEVETGTRAEGAVYGLIAFSQKVALGLGTGLVGIILDAVGYVANKPQSVETLHGIIRLYGLGPLLLFAASIVAIWAYPLDARYHQRLVQTLAERRKATA